MSSTDNDESQPLDPATEHLRRRLMRLMVVSIGVMLVGVLAVLAVVVFRAPDEAGAIPGDGRTLSVELPAGARVVETALSDSAILLRVQASDGLWLYRVSPATGTVTARYRLETGGENTSGAGEADG